jgi:flagellar protein FlaG
MAIDSISRVANTGYTSTTTTKPVTETAAANEAAQASADAKSVADATTVVSSSKQQSAGDSGAENKQADQKQPTMKDVSEINKVINHNTIAEFGYNEPTNRITIKIKDKETDEVIKEIPSEKALEMLAKAWELAGIMVDEKR